MPAHMWYHLIVVSCVPPPPIRRAGTNYHWKAEQLPPSAPWSEATLMAFKAFMYFSGKGKPKARCMLYHIFPAV